MTRSEILKPLFCFVFLGGCKYLFLGLIDTLRTGSHISLEIRILISFPGDSDPGLLPAGHSDLGFAS
jgi:hypothetical protein